MNDMSAALIPAPPEARRNQRSHAWLDLVVALQRGIDWIIIVGTGLATGHDLNLIALGLVIFAMLAELAGCHDADIHFSVRRGWGRLLTAWMATILFLLTLLLLLKSALQAAPVRVALWFALATLLLFAARAVAVLTLRHYRNAGWFNQRVAIYGANEQGNGLAQYIAQSRNLTINLVGLFDERNPTRLDPQIGPVGTLTSLITAIRTGMVDQVIIALPWSQDIYLRNVVSQLTMTPVRVRLAPDRALYAYPNRPIVMLGDLPMMTLFERPISGFDRVLKRAEDAALSALFLLAATPFLMLVAAAIKLDSPGPVFFRQPREGFNNYRFSIWKFRSMRADRGQTDAVQQATRRDPRITRVGRFIRATSIDELPQLFNVLIGDMSLVGPRPHAPSTRAGEKLFPDVVNTYAARHKVKPGITGWAQVCGWRGETDTEDKLIKRVEHDLHYIEHWSIRFDLYILLRTAFALVSSRAY